MAKTTVGMLTVFNHEVQEWALYKGRLEQWFMANDIADVEKSGSKKRAILLSSLAESTYRLVKDLALPADVGVLNYSEVVQLLDGHFQPKRCGFAERYRFHSSLQTAHETMAEWAARVRSLAQHCGFNASTLDEELRDRFVLGMVSGAERDKLFTIPLEELTLMKALQIAEAVRCAREGSQQTAPGTAAASLEVHRVEAARSGSAGRSLAPHPERGGAGSRPASAAAGVRCEVCGRKGHDSVKCKYAKYKCDKCGVAGHLKRVCTLRARQHFLEQEDNEDDGKPEKVICNIRSSRGEPMWETVLVNNIEIKFEIDTGSAVTVVSDETYNKYFSHISLTRNKKILQSYNGTIIDSLGMITLTFNYKSQNEELEVFVVRGGGPPLLGRDFMTKFNLQICAAVNNCSIIKIKERINSLVAAHPKLFGEGLGCFKNFEVKLNVKPDSKPFFFKARTVPFSLREKVEKELERMVSLGIIEPVQYSEYASPIVPVLRHHEDQKIRICADYSVSLNKQLKVEKYPLPKVDELFAQLHGCKHFTKLDLTSAYNQIKLSKESQKLTCINTHKGLFMYKRLVFGMASSGSIFQWVMESVLKGLEGVLVFLDDILVTGRSDEEHLHRLAVVFQRLQDAGFVLQKTKCRFFESSVSYLGYIIDEKGLHKTSDKVEAIRTAKVPENTSELKSFLGLVNYYRSFVKNASSILHPLHKLLKKDTRWQWGEEQERAVRDIKEALADESTLAHYNPDAKLILTVDASPSGLGAVLSQEDRGVERPIAYASRSLNVAEQRYAQIQKEATAIIFGVRKFHQYLYARDIPFILRTDHKPLVTIFRPDKGIPEVTANRLQRYAIFLSAYNYVIEYVRSAHNCADFLSRSTVATSAGGGGRSVGIGTSQSDLLDRAAYLNFVTEGDLPIRVADIVEATKADPTLQLIASYIRNGWPSKVATHLKPYYHCRHELAIEKQCLMRGYKVIIPATLREKVIAELHRGHMGANKMKMEARGRVWWPGLPTALEQHAAACNICSQLRPAPARAPLTVWPYPPRPWSRVHLDFLGPINGKVYLIAVDAYSKWVEVYDVSTGYGSQTVIEKLYELMARFGLFNTICTDNGTSFVSAEFSQFCTRNAIRHITTPTYNPASNGQAESYVKIIKKAIKGILLTGIAERRRHAKLQEFLFNYRNSIHSSTQRSPAQIIFGHNLPCRLDMINPRLPPQVDPLLDETTRQNQCSQVRMYKGKRQVTFAEGTIVLAKVDNKSSATWRKATVIKKIGKSVYMLKLHDNNKVIKKHANQILEYKGEEMPNKPSAPPARELGNNEEVVIPPMVLTTAAPAPAEAPASAPGQPANTEEADAGSDCPEPEVASRPPPAPAPAVPSLMNAATSRPSRSRTKVDYRPYL